jgi:hypothetical protein
VPFLKFEDHQTAIIVSSSAVGCHTPTQEVKIYKKWAKLPLLSVEGCHTQLYGSIAL